MKHYNSIKSRFISNNNSRNTETNEQKTITGEMLFQKRDDHVVIKLLLTPQELREQVKQCEQQLQE